jgi:hypothetical protein
MTGTVIQVVIDNVPRTPAQALASPAHAIVFALLLLVLVARLITRVATKPAEETITRALDVALGPLLAAFVLILYVRLLEIMPLG